MDADAVRERAATLPDEPGVYEFRADRTLYVGKAVSLRDRVRSYADPRSDRIAAMVARATEIDVVLTDTETQALLLEANLIKRHQPRYNVRLTDDKSYPLVEVTDHDCPRIGITRDPEEGATVYGPYTSKSDLETVLKAVREICGLRTCSDHEFARRDRPCLDYEMGLCSAPCTGAIDPEDYREDLTRAERFFEGATGAIADPLRERMDDAADRAAFERAAGLRDRLEAVEAFHGGDGGTVTSGPGRATDVIGVDASGAEAAVAVLHSDGGRVVDRERVTVETPDAVGPGAVVSAVVTQYYADRAVPDRLLVSHPPDRDLDDFLASTGIDLSAPTEGRGGRLVDLAVRNARQPHGDSQAGAALASTLGLDDCTRIEGMDVSHAGGDSVVGSDVLFVDGASEKRGYRRKRLSDGNDDPAHIAELATWRAERALAGRDDRPDPDLLVIDGGHAQLDAARDALDRVGWTPPTIALAKGEERVITPDRSYDWPSDDERWRLLARVRDEAHRFAVSYHRTLRDEVSTSLEAIEGVGPVLRARLLGRFGSVAAIRAADREELCAVEGVGPATADRLARAL
ncbi:MAG: excinuclease ABC subunit C [Halococcoides sp.]